MRRFLRARTKDRTRTASHAAGLRKHLAVVPLWLAVSHPVALLAWHFRARNSKSGTLSLAHPVSMHAEGKTRFKTLGAQELKQEPLATCTIAQ